MLHTCWNIMSQICPFFPPETSYYTHIILHNTVNHINNHPLWQILAKITLAKLTRYAWVNLQKLKLSIISTPQTFRSIKSNICIRRTFKKIVNLRHLSCDNCVTTVAAYELWRIKHNAPIQSSTQAIMLAY